MASLVGKRRGGRTYYYLVESARVAGKPRIIAQQYLGSGEELAARLSQTGPGEPARTRHRAFGDLAAAWQVLQRLQVVQVIDVQVGSRRADAAASVGTYLALAACNRVVAPRSKLAFAGWWQTTAGDRLVKLPAAALDHRRFWDAMDTLQVRALRTAERAIAARMVEVFDLDLAGLVLDMTNFATFVDSANQRNTIAQRGHAKQKRLDLRLVGVGLVVTADGGVPVLSHAYQGNRPDVTQFSAVIDELVARFGRLARATDALTVVYDAGCDSADGQADVQASPLHFVGSLRPSDHPDLLAIPARRFRVVDTTRFPGLTAVETRTMALGADRRVVITHSETFHLRQVRGFEQTLAKARRRLATLQARLARGRTRRPRQAVEAEITDILNPRWLSRVITWQLAGEEPASLRLRWRTDPTAKRRLAREVFGKRLLFTDREDWPLAEVVAAYRSQADVEAGFRQLKDPKVVSFSPMFHWTDQKIRVHVFYCVLALAVAHLLRRQAAQAGIVMSVRELLATLAGIQETVLLYQGARGRPRARHVLTEMDPIQQRLYDLFSLDAYAPKR
ncbi:MAG TPA: IS1634 family transposase [Actinomycetes bacterium]|jgi:transposase|nr:IS1634 family transposase [Actinomycetes bacterium]